MQAIDRAPRWSIKKLTATYLTLGLSEIGKEVGIANDDDTRKVVLDMVRIPPLLDFLLVIHSAFSDGTTLRPSQIECAEISAQISVSGTVTFFDPPSQSQFTKADVDRVLRESEEQAALLKRLELEMTRSREYLSKVCDNCLYFACFRVV